MANDVAAAVPPVDTPSEFYGYLFNEDRTPTEKLVALLRAIAEYIVSRALTQEDLELHSLRNHDAE